MSIEQIQDNTGAFSEAPAAVTTGRTVPAATVPVTTGTRDGSVFFNPTEKTTHVKDSGGNPVKISQNYDDQINELYQDVETLQVNGGANFQSKLAVASYGLSGVTNNYMVKYPAVTSAAAVPIVDKDGQPLANTGAILIRAKSLATSSSAVAVGVFYRSAGAWAYRSLVNKTDAALKIIPLIDAGVPAITTDKADPYDIYVMHEDYTSLGNQNGEFDPAWFVGYSASDGAGATNDKPIANIVYNGSLIQEIHYEDASYELYTYSNGLVSTIAYYDEGATLMYTDTYSYNGNAQLVSTTRA